MNRQPTADRLRPGKIAAAQHMVHRLHRRLRLLARAFLILLLAGLAGGLLIALALELNPIEQAISLVGIVAGFLSGLYTARRMQETTARWHPRLAFVRLKAAHRTT